MAQKKQRLDPLSYEAAEPMIESEINAADHNFVLVEEEEKPQPVVLISAEEQERRELRSRYKKIFGFKPVIKDTAELRAIVEDAEHQRALKRDGII